MNSLNIFSSPWTNRFLILILLISSCKKETTVEASNYANPDFWLSLPATSDKKVDVFYLYPTVWQKLSETDSNICEIDNPMMLANSKIAFNRQATAFETVGNIYAPYYRQADAAYVLSLEQKEQEAFVGGIPKSDVFDAFDYYIRNLNNDRPFILAGHSQGSNVLLFLLAEYMKKNQDVYRRMVAAYIIGCSVTDEYLLKNSHLKFAENADDTGVLISYNTEAPLIGEPGNPVILEGAIAINPITWTRTETIATAAESLGTLLIDDDGKQQTILSFADARVDISRGVVICSTVNADVLSPGDEQYGKGVFHRFDYPFYYYNIRENAANRVAKYMATY